MSLENAKVKHDELKLLVEGVVERANKRMARRSEHMKSDGITTPVWSKQMQGELVESDVDLLYMSVHTLEALGALVDVVDTLVEQVKKLTSENRALSTKKTTKRKGVAR